MDDLANMPISTAEPDPEQEEFGEFCEAQPEEKKIPATKIDTPLMKEEAPPVKTEKKSTIWDDAKDVLDMDNLMVTTNQKTYNPYANAFDFANQGFY